jgi:hypothetical protein
MGHVEAPLPLPPITTTRAVLALMKHLRTMASIDDELDSGLTRVDPDDIRDYIGDADVSLLRTLLSLARADFTVLSTSRRRR